MADSKYGFTLISSEQVKEADGTVDIYSHKKSGATLVHVNNAEREKVFGIAFRTAPENSTGVPHIIEHSVLCGSKKFPVKEPFVELMKASLNTFLNAMTFSDFTMYPVASINDKDFHNLTQVYLDAVLAPLIHEEPLTLAQEGWHYERDENGELFLNGVVYNEMRGAYSSPDRIMGYALESALFDNTYGYSSGGDPDVIPELTQEEFTKFHAEHYIPSNAIVCLYGDVRLDEILPLIASYFDGYDDNGVRRIVPLVPAFEKPVVLEKEFDVSPDDDPKTNAHLGFAWVIGDATDNKLNRRMEILDRVLVGSDSSPLKLAVLSSGLAQNIVSSFDNSMRQTVYTIVIKGCDEQNRDKLRELIMGTLRQLSGDGIDKTLAAAATSSVEFEWRENSFGSGTPKGLVAAINMVIGWDHHGDPAEMLRYDDFLVEFKNELNDRVLEKLISDRLLNNPHSCEVLLRPAVGIAAKKAEALKEKLRAYSASLTPRQNAEIDENTRRLKEKQATPDTAEALASIPKLTLEDIDEHAVGKDIVKTGDNSFEYETASNGIAYLTLGFDTASVADDELYLLGVLPELLGKISTADRDYVALANKIMLHTGGIGCKNPTYACIDDVNSFSPRFELSVKATLANIPEAVSLVNEILAKTDYTDAARIKQLLAALKQRKGVMAMNAGHQFTFWRTASYFSRSSLYNEIINGIESIRTLGALIDELESSPEAACARIRAVAEKLFRAGNMEIRLAGGKDEIAALRKGLSVLSLPQGAAAAEKRLLTPTKKNEGFVCPSAVNYVATGANSKALGFKRSGAVSVAKLLLRSDYLWNRVRVQGGAYGAMIVLAADGTTCFMSYRDPNTGDTLTAYRETAKFLREKELSQNELEGYIIGAISDLDAPLTPSDESDRAYAWLKTGFTVERRAAERSEIIHAVPADVKALADMFDAVCAEGNICAIGGAKIEESRELFGSVTNLL